MCVCLSLFIIQKITRKQRMNRGMEETFNRKSYNIFSLLNELQFKISVFLFSVICNKV